MAFLSKTLQRIFLLLLVSSLAPSFECKRFKLKSGSGDEGSVGPLLSDGLDGPGSISQSEMGLAVYPQYPNNTMTVSEGTCEQTYGFLPCTETALGNLFLLVVYGFFMFKAASFLSDGSELLLSLMGPGLVGGLLLPILGALPDTLLILVAGVSGTKETAQEQVVIGMGLLAGSTVMLLTALWGSCLLVGKCDLNQEEEIITIDNQDTMGCSLFGSGVSVDKSTRTASQIMAITIIPFVIAQIPLMFNLQSAKHISVLIACIVAFVCLIAYCVFQVIQPWIQKRRLAFLKYRHVMSTILLGMQCRHFGRLIKPNGEPDDTIVERVFEDLDADKDKRLSKGELRGLLVGLELHESYLTSDVLDRVMADLDEVRDDYITLAELKNGLRRWYAIATSHVGLEKRNSIVRHFHQKNKEELEALINGDGEEEEGIDEDPGKVYMKAAFLLLAGAVIAGVFADPLVDAVDNFSSATKIPSFFISFIAMPLATNSSEAISALIFAMRKRKQTASLTYSEIYGGVTMNNTLCLGVFLAIVYMRGLDWDFSAEVLVILVVIAVTGIMGSFFTTYPLWMTVIAYLMYPLTLVMVYVLDYVLGWS
eukprot:TRINITY_DN32947_c0_g1_i1.p1 TRINITY_DN32947_c0_g1~~TRINITY_DN32947_c0_g1_i1.p1  ORF type:complete len:594 (-),score=92.52 TRINITY_DN32947_c0_g1_i1:151-1932(-)